jgi:hypothetical protein
MRADPGQVELAVVNLAVNARDAMPDGGTLTIATAGAADGGVVLRISDTGCGMDERVKSHLFEPFFTTKALGAGTGLGLSTVYGIVKQSGGSISVESARGAGTTVAVSFPPPSQEPSVTGDGFSHEGLAGRESILIVEEERGAGVQGGERGERGRGCGPGPRRVRPARDGHGPAGDERQGTGRKTAFPMSGHEGALPVRR